MCVYNTYLVGVDVNNSTKFQNMCACLRLSLCVCVFVYAYVCVDL